VRGIGSVLAIVPEGHPSERIAHGKTLKVWHLSVLQFGSERGEVVPSVAFRRDVERGLGILWITCKPLLNKLGVVRGGHFVTVVHWAGYGRETNSCRLFDEDHVCDLVPCVRIHLEFTVGHGSERALL